jgi:hypothetical protein
MLRIPFFLDISTLEDEDTVHVVMQHHMPEEWNPQLHCYKNLNTHNLNVMNIILSLLHDEGKRKKMCKKFLTL